MPLCSPGAYPVTGETLHEAEDGAVEDVGDDAAVALLLPPPAAGARHLGWGHSTGLGPALPARLRGGRPGDCLARTRVRSGSVTRLGMQFGCWGLGRGL